MHKLRIFTFCSSLLFSFSALSQSISISAGGDVNFNRDQVPAGSQHTIHKGAQLEWDDMTRGLRGLFDSDLNFANIEAVVSDRALTPYPKTWNFLSHPNSIEHLVREGFNLFSLNNNHTYDYGQAGINDTYANMTSLSNRYSDVNWHGVGNRSETIRPRIFYKNGVKIAFSAIGIFGASEFYSGDTRIGALNVRSSSHYDAVLAGLRDSDAAFKILSIHQGVEGNVGVSDAEKRLFRRAVDEAGVSYVIGHHPHVVKPVEHYNGSVIAYSLGNLMLIGAANNNSAANGYDYGLVLKAEFDWSDHYKRYTARSIMAFPLKSVHDYPTLLNAEQNQRKINFFNSLNRRYFGENSLVFSY